jgi:hypothetical protein
VGAAEIVALGAALVAVFGSIGAVVRWTAARFKEQGDTINTLREAQLDLREANGVLRIQIQKTQLAFQMVATELARKSPGNHALALAKSLLDEAFRVDASIPPDMQAELDQMD